MGTALFQVFFYGKKLQHFNDIEARQKDKARNIETER